MFPAPLQPQSKARKPRSKTKSKIDLFKKCIEEKIQLFKEQAPEDLLEKVSASAHRGGLAGGRTEPWGAVAAHLNPAPSFYTVPLGGLPIPSPLLPWGAGGCLPPVGSSGLTSSAASAAHGCCHPVPGSVPRSSHRGLHRAASRLPTPHLSCMPSPALCPISPPTSLPCAFLITPQLHFCFCAYRAYTSCCFPRVLPSSWIYLSASLYLDKWTLSSAVLGRCLCPRVSPPPRSPPRTPGSPIYPSPRQLPSWHVSRCSAVYQDAEDTASDVPGIVLTTCGDRGDRGSPGPRSQETHV